MVFFLLLVKNVLFIPYSIFKINLFITINLFRYNRSAAEALLADDLILASAILEVSHTRTHARTYRQIHTHTYTTELQFNLALFCIILFYFMFLSNGINHLKHLSY